jgi:cell division protein FtsB
MSIAPHEVTPLAAGALQNLIDRVAELETLKPRVEALENTNAMLVHEVDRLNQERALRKQNSLEELCLQENGVQLQYRGEID